MFGLEPLPPEALEEFVTKVEALRLAEGIRWTDEDRQDCRHWAHVACNELRPPREPDDPFRGLEMPRWDALNEVLQVGLLVDEVLEAVERSPLSESRLASGHDIGGALLRTRELLDRLGAAPPAPTAPRRAGAKKDRELNLAVNAARRLLDFLDLPLSMGEGRSNPPRRPACRLVAAACVDRGIQVGHQGRDPERLAERLERVVMKDGRARSTSRTSR